MSGGHEVTCWITVIRDVYRRLQPEVVGLTAEDEGPSIVCLQGIPRESGKGNRLEVKSGLTDNGGEYRG